MLYSSHAMGLNPALKTRSGGFDFDVLLSADECNRPSWAYEASVWMLAGYEIIMAILLLNLLIAVMATVSLVVAVFR